MRRTAPVWAVLLTIGWGTAGVAQILHPISDVRSNYAKGIVACGDSTELTTTPSALFAAFDDTLFANQTTCQGSLVTAGVIQHSVVRGDSIQVEEFFQSDAAGPEPVVATARSDATIRFRIEAGQQCACAYEIYFAGQQNGAGRGYMKWSFVKLGSAGTTVLGSVDIELVSPGEQTGHDYRETILHAGDYVLDVHVFGDNGGFIFGTMLASVKLSHMTGVSEASWTRVKALYR
jgi:hypothetical protein